MTTNAPGEDSPQRESALRTSILEEKHMVSIIMFLMENDGCRKTDLYDAVAYNVRMPDKLDRLESSGIITQERREGRGFTIHLTELGRTVGEGLARIEAVMVEAEGVGP